LRGRIRKELLPARVSIAKRTQQHDDQSGKPWARSRAFEQQLSPTSPIQVPKREFSTGFAS
jgi:hypothetical protein